MAPTFPYGWGVGVPAITPQIFGFCGWEGWGGEKKKKTTKGVYNGKKEKKKEKTFLKISFFPPSLKKNLVGTFGQKWGAPLPALSAKKTGLPKMKNHFLTKRKKKLGIFFLKNKAAKFPEKV